MESDEDETFIIVVGNDIDKSFPQCLQLKNEDDLISEDLLKEVVYSDFESSVKDELEHEDDISLEAEEPLKRETEEFSLDDTELSDDSVIVPEPKIRKRNRKLKPNERHSYVESIKKLHPELRKDKQLLVDSLVAIMKETKPPPLPMDYYTMDGIMLQCNECSHQSESLRAASRHFQQKHGQRYLYCLACGVNFRSTTNLYKHEKICDAADADAVLRARAACLGRKGRARPYVDSSQPKAQPRKFDCQQCSASFASKYSLRAHSHMHAGLRPYVCRFCRRGYTCSITLARHVKKHDSSERYVCDHCQRSFNVKASLVVHLDTHQPLKRFSCAECAARYCTRAALRLHVRRQHRGLPPPCACKLCPRRYPRMSLLKEHMGKVHGMKLMTRNMFFKKLPTLTAVQVQQAKLVMKSEDDLLLYT